MEIQHLAVQFTLSKPVRVLLLRAEFKMLHMFFVIQDHETCDVIAANVSHRRNAASLSKAGALNYIAAAYILGASAVSNNKIPRGGSDYITWAASKSPQKAAAILSLIISIKFAMFERALQHANSLLTTDWKGLKN